MRVYHRYLTRILSLPPKIVLKRVKRKIRNRLIRYLGRLYAYWSKPMVSDRDLLQALDKRFSDMDDFWRRPRETGFFSRARKRKEFAYYIRNVSADSELLSVAMANQVCQHVFDLLGSGPTHLGEKIDWHVDFKTRHGFNPRQYYRDIRPAPYPGGYDIKVPWELSRCQHFAWLGQAYWFTADEKYAQEFVDQVEDWIASNPWPWGVNWTCTMDVAIRLVNWLWGYHFFLQSPRLSERFVLSFYKSLLQHGRHIYRNLENQDDFTGNHYLSNLVGLIYLGILCHEFKEAVVWREFGLRELEKEMFKQVYADGVNFEASTSYHRLTLEMFLSATILAQRNGHQFGADYLARLEKMVEFVMYLTKPDGTSPLIGDNDNGRLHRLKVWDPPEREWVDFRYLLAIGAMLFRREDLAQAAGDQWEEAIWLWGEEALRFKQEVDARQLPLLQLTSKVFQDAGLYIIRHNDCYLVVNAGPNGQNGNGGHAHNDTLSFELYANGETWILDPGTYVYTSDYRARNLFRSTAFHNTVLVDAQEQNRFNQRECFQMQEQSPPTVLHWECNNDYIFLFGEHYGYRRLPQPVKQQRAFFLDRNMEVMVIVDFVDPPTPYLCCTYLNFAPRVYVGKNNYGLSLSLPGNKVAFVYPEHDQFARAELSSGFISSSYGSRTATRRVCWTWTGDKSNTYVISWGEAKSVSTINICIALTFDRLSELKSYCGLLKT